MGSVECETTSVPCVIAYMVMPCPIWSCDPSFPATCSFGLEALSFFQDTYVDIWVRPWLLDSLPNSPQGSTPWGAGHTLVPFAIAQIFLCFAVSLFAFLGLCLGGSIRPLIQKVQMSTLSLTPDFSSLLSSRPGKLFPLRGDGSPSSNHLKPLANPVFLSAWLTQDFSTLALLVFWTRYVFVVWAVLCIIGRLAASLALTH